MRASGRGSFVRVLHPGIGPSRRGAARYALATCRLPTRRPRSPDDRTAAPAHSLENVWLVQATYAPDAAETRVPFRARHLARIATLKAAGTIVEAGAFLDMSGVPADGPRRGRGRRHRDRPPGHLHAERRVGRAARQAVRSRRARSGGVAAADRAASARAHDARRVHRRRAPPAARPRRTPRSRAARRGASGRGRRAGAGPRPRAPRDPGRAALRASDQGTRGGPARWRRPGRPPRPPVAGAGAGRAACTLVASTTVRRPVPQPPRQGRVEGGEGRARWRAWSAASPEIALPEARPTRAPRTAAKWRAANVDLPLPAAPDEDDQARIRQDDDRRRHPFPP